jgi:DNA-binding LytR/AlgR family response regulator
MPIKIAICDDSLEDIVQLSSALSAYDSLIEITTFASGEMLLAAFLEANFSVDLIFLDIYMSGIDGIKTAQEIRSKHKEVKIIFLSSSNDYYPQAYDVFAFNYIIKPFEKERLYAVLERALDELHKEHGYKIRIQYKGVAHSVDCRDILYIESKDKLLLFYLADEDVLQCYGKLDEMLKELPAQSFFRCHQSFVVNLFHVTEIADHYFRIRQNIIGISRKYAKQAKQRYYTCLFSDMDGGQAR